MKVFAWSYSACSERSRYERLQSTHDVAIEGFLVPHKVQDDCSQRCLIALEACDHRSEESIRIKPLKIDGMSGLICQQEEE